MSPVVLTRERTYCGDKSLVVLTREGTCCGDKSLVVFTGGGLLHRYMATFRGVKYYYFTAPSVAFLKSEINRKSLK